MRLVGSPHFYVEDNVRFNLIQYGDEQLGHLIVQFSDGEGSYPNIIISTSEVHREKWERAVAAFNAAMEG